MEAPTSTAQFYFCFLILNLQNLSPNLALGMEGQLLIDSRNHWFLGTMVASSGRTLACLFLRGIPVGTVIRKENVLLILFPVMAEFGLVVYITCFKHITNLLSD